MNVSPDCFLDLYTSHKTLEEKECKQIIWMCVYMHNFRKTTMIFFPIEKKLFICFAFIS